jgi:hypothetical protein
MTLLEELATVMQRLLMGKGTVEDQKRMRISVTSDEYATLTTEAFDRGDDFYNCIRGIFYVVENEPVYLAQTVRPKSWVKSK